MSRTTASSDLSRRPLTELAFFWRFAFVFLIVGLAYAAMVELVPDEALYWVWSRHLKPGYLDHPPMIAYLIWLGTHVLGSTEIGVRVAGVLMSAGAIIVAVLLAKRLFRDERAAVWVAIIWLTSPLLSLVGLIFTPDMPAIFFSICGLAIAAVIADRDDQQQPSSSAGLWLLFGLFTGLALLSKYTAVLLPAGVALAFLFSRTGRVHFRRPWIYLSAVLALSIFSPVIWWNARHQWASFRFQLHHGTAAHEKVANAASAIIAQWLRDLGTYVGEQLLVWTPILFAIAILVLVRYWRRYRQITQVDRVLLWTGTLPLAFFGAACLKAHHTEANWPAFAYFPISLLTVRWLSETWSANRVNWVKGGCQLAFGFLVVLHAMALPPVTKWVLGLPFKMPHGFRDLYGWREYGQTLGAWSRDLGAPVICNRHEDASEAAFYMPGQPDVWCIGIGSRPTAFEYFDEKRDFAKIPRILWVGGHHELFCREYGYRVVTEQTEIFFLRSRRYRSLDAFLLERLPPEN